MKGKDMIGLMKFNPGCPVGSQQRWVDICLQSDREEKAWIQELRASGIKAAHPDDGWVNREKNEVHLAYPQFNDGLDVGDKMALGWPDKFRIVEITGYRSGPFLSYRQFKEKA